MRLVLCLALLIALGAAGRRLLAAARLRRLRGALPGASPERAIPVASYTEIDEHVRDRRCPCGGAYTSLGEGGAEAGGRSLRVVRLECRRCEELSWMYFDTSPASPAPTLH